ncbi:uncharacterized protein LOC133730390 [Rosa rugosa]|uniref:uncharacterized protein LOC133730390 n=1 Tax=Rosa rugosa TaxID=74645 RepID=UPI002B409F2A|nr:uncharacterized protein LOC133730390 [Rosa rugosa]
MEVFKSLHLALGFPNSKEVHSDGQAGGLALFWSAEIDLQVRTRSAHHIDAVIHGGPGDPRWRLTGFYGYARTAERDRSWKLLRDLGDLDSLPWVVIGDFNEILNNGEKIDGPPRAKRQRAKVTWLKEGDRNTGFFHRKATNRKRKNAIHGLFDEHGVWREDDAGVEQIVTSYFKNMFTDSPIDMEAMNTTLEAIQPSVTPEMNAQLCQVYTEDEIRCALFHMYPTKSPGLDGMPPLFFQHYWEVIGKDVTEAVQDFLHTGNLLKQVNFTHICLIPKVNNPEKMSDLRPIALCNVLYKICSKAIANRLKLLLLDIISPYQSAFVPGRLITDNILVANEIAHFVHNKRDGFDGFMALKLDFSKAYDRMEWLFLRKVMERFGFTRGWIDMVMQCVCSVRFSFFIRGKPRGLVIPSRGLRQGDLLSPYLFLIGAKGFSALLQQKHLLGLLPGVEVCSEAPSVNHLLFADDSMLYAQASLEACYEIQDVIDTYGRASGQLVNFNKSSVVFSKNVQVDVQDEVASFLGVDIVESHEKYLGLPTYVGRKKTATFQYIKDNLAKKLKHWQGKLLSGAGKDILIWVVAQALPTYAMSVFQLTKKFCEDLEQMCARFWWGSTEDKRKIHWKAWEALCHPKEEGGLGFRSLTDFNMAMLAKQVWRIASNQESLIARIYKARYFPESSFWEAPAHNAPSYSWRSIFASRELLKTGSYWQIGTGVSVRVWSDVWIPGFPNLVPNTDSPLFDENMTVSELLCAPGRWDEEKVLAVFTIEVADAVLTIPLTRRLVHDRIVWRLEKKGEFSVKTAYRHAFSTSVERPGILETTTIQFWKKLWQANIPCTAKVHVWKIFHNILPSLERLVAKHVMIESQLCVLCIGSVESTLHLCRDCIFSRGVLSSNPSIAQVCFTAETDGLGVLEWLMFCANSRRAAGDVRWKGPLIGCVKLNTDGAFCSETGAGGSGLVLRDHLGKFLACKGRAVRGLISAEHAKLLAIKTAINFIVERSLQPAIVETDSLLVQQQLLGNGNNLSRLGRIYEDLRLQLAAMPNVNIVHTRREANKAAHLTATQAHSSG